MSTLKEDARNIILQAIQASLPDEAVKKAICGKSLGRTAYSISPTNTIKGVIFTVL